MHSCRVGYSRDVCMYVDDSPKFLAADWPNAKYTNLNKSGAQCERWAEKQVPSNDVLSSSASTTPCPEYTLPYLQL